MRKDWTTRPFVSINIRQVCNIDEEPIFTQRWPGTITGCLEDETNALDTCEFPIHAVDPIDQTSFGGLKICGERGGLPFAEVLRPDT